MYEFDTSNQTVTNILAGYKVGTGAASDGFESPKYLEFGTNFISADDPGAPGVPEPSGILAGLGLLGMIGGGALRARRRRRNR